MIDSPFDEWSLFLERMVCGFHALVEYTYDPLSRIFLDTITGNHRNEGLVLSVEVDSLCNISFMNAFDKELVSFNKFDMLCLFYCSYAYLITSIIFSEKCYAI